MGMSRIGRNPVGVEARVTKRTRGSRLRGNPGLGVVTPSAYSINQRQSGLQWRVWFKWRRVV